MQTKIYKSLCCDKIGKNMLSYSSTGVNGLLTVTPEVGVLGSLSINNFNP